MLSRRYHGLNLSELVVLTSSECFVLEMMIDNLNYHSHNIKPMIEDLIKRRKDFKNMNMSSFSLDATRLLSCHFLP